MQPQKTGRNKNMLYATALMAALAAVLFFVAYIKGDGTHLKGLKIGGWMVVEILPLILFAFITAGMVQVLIPPDAVAKWVGADSGIKGILLGSIAGGFTPGGPYVSLPVAAGLYRAGAGIGTMVAFVTAWSLIAVARLPMEVGIMGWRFTVIRLACTFFFPPIAGLLARAVFKV